MKISKLKYLAHLAFATAALMIAVLVWVIYDASVQSQESVRWVSHTLEVIRSIDKVSDDLGQAEVAQRGYLLSGLDPFLSERDQALVRLGNDSRVVQKLTFDNPDQQRRSAQLMELIAARVLLMKENEQRRKTQGIAAASAHVVAGVGQKANTRITELVEEMQQDELRLLQLRREGTQNRYNSSLIGLVVVVLVSLVVLGYFGFVAQARRLVQATQYARSLIEASLDPLVTISLDGKIMDVNEATAEVTGVLREELIGSDFSNYFTDLAKAREGYQLVFANGSVTDYPLTIRHHGGKLTDVLYNAALYKDAKGTVQGVFAAARDVTESRRLEQVLQQKNVELVSARLVADKANRSKSDFLSAMSHEIRTPMNAIIGMTHLALKTELTPRQRDYMKKIQGAGKALLGIINDILDFSKIEADKLTLEQIGFTLEKVLDNVASLITEKTTLKGLELVFDVSHDVPADLVGDPLRLGQILINYVNNAVKFTDKGEIDVIIRLREQSDKEVLLYFAVRDTGIGLTAEQCGRLFQSFQQVDTSITRKYGGTGLGLVIAKNLAELMHGEVGVDSEYGKGSTFWFTARFGKGLRNKPPQILRADLQGCRALVVDDNENARTVLADLLKSMNFVIDDVASGKEAIAAVDHAELQGKPYDIVFLDWSMPGMDGIETARQLRALPLKRSPHLVLVTAYGREDVIKGAEEAELEDVLIKPVSASVLFNCVALVLGGIPTERRELIDTPSLLEDKLVSLKGARVLLVEDNDLNQEVAMELLADVGFIVDLAENGEIALRKVQETAYDMVLMDMQMPVMDGVTATREIRKLPQFAHLPIVAMTANAMVGDRQRCLEAGMNDHVAKPIEPEDLWKALLKWVKPRHGIDAPLSAASQREADNEIPVGIAGLDTETGLRRVLGKKPLYMSMLRKFVAGQKNTVAAIRAALDSGDLETAERLAHTAKGVAGNIGATQLQLHATEVERCVRERRPRDEMEAQLATLATQMDELLAALVDALPPEEDSMQMTVDWTGLDPLCEKLEALLVYGDAAAIDVVTENAALLRAAYPNHYRRIDAAIRAIDFESALALLRDAIATTVPGTTS